MEIRVFWFGVNASLAAGKPPVFAYERPLARGRDDGTVFSHAQVARVGKYLTPKAPLTSQDPEWTVTADGQFVMIPVSAYRTHVRSQAAVFGLGLELGLRAATRTLAGRVTGVVLVLGDDVTELEDGVRCYVGLALQVE
jgi:hypothetical protein